MPLGLLACGFKTDNFWVGRLLSREFTRGRRGLLSVSARRLRHLHLVITAFDGRVRHLCLGGRRGGIKIILGGRRSWLKWLLLQLPTRYVATVPVGLLIVMELDLVPEMWPDSRSHACALLSAGHEEFFVDKRRLVRRLNLIALQIVVHRQI